MPETIDELLARYLVLLHEYMELRSQLSAQQAAMYGHLARANFAAERGFRYGPDHFDGRMQALAKLNVAEEAGGTLSFAVVRPKKESKEPKEPKKDEAEDEAADAPPAEVKPKQKKPARKAPPGPRDPLQWFGVLTPMALRQAQQQAVVAIDSTVPRLAALSTEMAAVEIEVRRARKKRARALEKQDKEAHDASEAVSA